MKIQILGTGCSKCKRLEENTKEAVSELGIDCEIEKVTDLNEIMEYGVMMTPGFAINKKVKSAGKLLSTSQITGLLKKEVY